MERKFKILIIDDMPKNIQLAANMIKSDNIDISFTREGKSAIEIIEKETFDLILLDIMMPEMSGFEVCEKIKSNPLTSEIPIIFLTAKTDMDSLLKGFELGAVDYVTKPFNSRELKSRVYAHLELKANRDELKTLNEELIKKNHELNKAYEELQAKNQMLNTLNNKLDEVSKTDELTKLSNRRYLIDKVKDEITRVKRTQKSFSVIIGDIDNFKNINDNNGHDFGDYVLREISNILKNTARQMDHVGRWGGEEFLLLLPETEIDGARILAERLRKYVEDFDFNYNNKSIKATMTFGTAYFEFDSDFDDTFRKADEALYYGKNNGKNCVI